MMRNLLDKLEPHFHKGGKWEKLVRTFRSCGHGSLQAFRCD